MLEGGSIEVNGAGWLMTTEECLLSPIQQRNPGWTVRAVESMVGEHLGVRRIVWLGNGIVGDDTHGHIDDLARFTAAFQAVIASEEDPSRSELRALAGELRVAKENRALGAQTADACAALVRRSSAAGELCEFLYR